MSRPMMIGDLASKTRTKVNTIRFYEEIGLMPRPARTTSGRRIYDSSGLRRLAFIRQARTLGFSTGEIRSLLTLSDRPGDDCAGITQIASRHLDHVNRKLEQLSSLRDELERVVRLCSGGETADCKILDSLSKI